MIKIVATISILLLVGAGVYFLFSGNKTNLNSTSSKSDIVVEPKQIEGYQGQVLAGSVSPFLEFNPADYEKAKTEGKIILLDFYANWCPICRAEEPEIFEGFNELNNPNVIGFRVNFNDSDTDESEKALAQEFKVPYQHTKVIIENGQEIGRYTNQWEKQDFLDAFNKSL